MIHCTCVNMNSKELYYSNCKMINSLENVPFPKYTVKTNTLTLWVTLTKYCIRWSLTFTVQNSKLCWSMFDTFKFFLYSIKVILQFQLFYFKYQSFVWFLFFNIPALLHIATFYHGFYSSACCIFINHLFLVAFI